MMDKEFYYKDTYRFILHNSSVYRNFDLIDKCVIQVLKQNPPNDNIWYAINIGNSVPCFKGIGSTKEEALDKMFASMREFFLEEKEQSEKMVALTNKILNQ